MSKELEEFSPQQELWTLPKAAASREGLEPVAAVRNPPRGEEDGDCGEKGPPEWQEEIGQQSKQDERSPEDFLLHERDCKPARAKSKRH